MDKKNVYFFGSGKAEGSTSMKNLLGGKGANLAEMTNLNIPVPPGFTISTKVCKIYSEKNHSYPEDVKKEIESNIVKLEKETNKKFGDPKDPLLVSVRSGAAISMPGMMDTVLNLGLNSTSVVALGQISGNPRFAWDSYRRFIQMFGDVVMGVSHSLFEDKLTSIKNFHNYDLDTELNVDDLKELVNLYKEVYKDNTGESFPEDPLVQLWAAIGAVFGSWNNERAVKYRTINKIDGLIGTAVNVQSMVFGNFGDDSGTGVCFSRDPATGDNYFYGEYLMNAQGEDVVAGIRTPQKLSTLESENPQLYKELLDVKQTLENHYKDMQDMEFTIERGKLFLLQTRNGKRTGQAAVKVAVDLVSEGLIDKETAIMRVTPDQLDQLLHPMIDPTTLNSLKAVATGLNASPGAACGEIVFTPEDAEAKALEGRNVLLVRRETSPEDIGGMNAAEGILTATGGMTSHAAVVARGMGKPCVAGCKAVEISGKAMKIGNNYFKEGDTITIDGSSGNVYSGKCILVYPKLTDQLEIFLKWSDEVRESATRDGVKKGFDVRANADLPEDAKRAREFGAVGIGLCRTEHMFFDEAKLEHFRRMIVADSLSERVEALETIKDLQISDFKGIFKVMDGLPVTIRLLDPPLHEFVPGDEFDSLAKMLHKDVSELKLRIESLKEQNPMLGHRGCRLGITYPEIYDMQIEAIIRGAIFCQREGIKVFPEIMIPLVGTVNELKILRERSEIIITRLFDELKDSVPYKIGTMIEIPRAALTADKIAEYADFFSFGTNDLTQMTFGYSRDDVGSFVPEYLSKKILQNDPFQVLDEEGVGQLVITAVNKGRSVKSDLKMSICGEHGGEAKSIDFVYRSGLNLVSCSPFRVPLARLAGAQSVIRNRT
ncbi:pyruvate, phosphate dikinase [Thiospirochaeta perfilievii]|uniref:Pyruvate, phosphate dikinase n=1 Tax=Thiospirochaeta perfilievii TaxID=252967 RepID=A0A5C1QAJ9_9SPIO|nr:pyruvate, phosphate dikinase [Thiospirochaeta perfilievii]QEN03826.1 pyruvate, phosphate dikinase [Thiospirochaeta perfilievii]